MEEKQGISSLFVGKYGKGRNSGESKIAVYGAPYGDIVGVIHVSPGDPGCHSERSRLWRRSRRIRILASKAAKKERILRRASLAQDDKGGCRAGDSCIARSLLRKFQFVGLLDDCCGAAAPLPLPLGEVPQCAHWGGEGVVGQGECGKETLSVKNRFRRADFCQLSQRESQGRLRRQTERQTEIFHPDIKNAPCRYRQGALDLMRWRWLCGACG